MPLHDWTDLTGWEGVHHTWLTELLYWIKPRLPEGYRTFIGTTPTFTITAPVQDRPDISVRTEPPSPGESVSSSDRPSGEDPAWSREVEMAVATLPPDRALFVERQGYLVAAVELVSPRNKDRLSAKQNYAAIYAGYLRRGVHLLLVDLHPRPLRFSFAEEIARDLEFAQPPTPSPFAISYRVGEEAPNGGRFLAIGRRPLTVGQPLPTLPLALTVRQSVPVDLEHTYARAAESAYLG
jgi:hypothetical protein